MSLMGGICCAELVAQLNLYKILEPRSRQTQQDRMEQWHSLTILQVCQGESNWIRISYARAIFLIHVHIYSLCHAIRRFAPTISPMNIAKGFSLVDMTYSAFQGFHVLHRHAAHLHQFGITHVCNLPHIFVYTPCSFIILPHLFCTGSPTFKDDAHHQLRQKGRKTHSYISMNFSMHQVMNEQIL